MIKYKSGLIEYEINIDNILYIESYRNEIIIHTKLLDYSRRFSLKKILKELDNRFVQCHKSYLVNIENVTSLFYDHLEINNIIKIPVGRKYQLLVKNKYQNYQNRNF
ncbi:LytTR family DNA-binding domain-containing protein [Coprobacillaceae bacterium CR2/5/TPMF4]|nr:LytTR family DNA-binding domain-containing protein [Coprobacillaceae bacterium CR2/5/TPMF4]